jgi:hypothetical protein
MLRETNKKKLGIRTNSTKKKKKRGKMGEKRNIRRTNQKKS